MKCKYCETENHSNATVCQCCKAELNTKLPELQTIVVLEDCQKNVPELLVMHTYDLLQLLRLVREERTKVYNYMRMSKKAAEQTSIDPETIKYYQDEYVNFSTRSKIIGNILTERLGYLPKRIDNLLLVRYEEKLAK